MRESVDVLYPFAGESLCNCTAIRQAARHMQRFYDACLAETGLRGTQYTVLLYLSRQQPTTVNALAEALVMDRTTVGHAVKPLERENLVAIEVDPADRRSRLISLTPQGAARVQDGLAAWSKAQRLFEAKFGSDRAKELRRTMAEVVETPLDPNLH